MDGKLKFAALEKTTYTVPYDQGITETLPHKLAHMTFSVSILLWTKYLSYYYNPIVYYYYPIAYYYDS